MQARPWRFSTSGVAQPSARCQPPWDQLCLSGLEKTSLWVTSSTRMCRVRGWQQRGRQGDR
eukprot:9614764-Lingulodinium_polyedra.AAC.1